MFLLCVIEIVFIFAVYKCMNIINIVQYSACAQEWYTYENMLNANTRTNEKALYCLPITNDYYCELCTARFCVQPTAFRANYGFVVVVWLSTAA